MEVGDGGLTEDAANMLGVLPEVVNVVAAKTWGGQPVWVFGGFEGDGLKCWKARICFEDLGGAGVLGLHPSHGAVAGDVFKPGVLVFGGLLLREDRAREARAQTCGKKHCERAEIRASEHA